MKDELVKEMKKTNLKVHKIKRVKVVEDIDLHLEKIIIFAVKRNQ